MAAEQDHITKVLKTYGDELETGLKVASPSSAARKRVIVRGVILLTRLIGQYVDRYVPQVRDLLISPPVSFVRTGRVLNL